ncbi:stage II sporulation protein M [Serpentinicella sp. ANB-PHB4]|uniref:stage II sporulation protein M n=1 Tax=Serpentinicella sp. ANB-PHB4 TaxID=3074076 RepID=UPI00285A446C|nr:stage II sporulation protein M [Serpentinicella sp. ANB-PHB4]MDR5658171.1 stage II sporulation protein M [Serpentinicella sp. ANB-PHB4]
MVYQFIRQVKKHIKSNMIIYSVLVFFYLVGISVGSFTIKVVDKHHKEELFYFLDGFFQNFISNEFAGIEIVRQSLSNNLPLLGLSWILGLLILTAPFIILIIIFKGFIIGFSTGLLIEKFSGIGLMVLFLGVLPQNLIIIATFMLATQISISFALNTFRKSSKQMDLSKRVIMYSMFYLILTCIIVVASLIEGFIGPIFIKLIFKVFN